MKRLKVLHLITHLALGGAQETVLTTYRLASAERFETTILTGKTASDEQSMLPEAIASGVPIHIVPNLRRSVTPHLEWRAYYELVRWFRSHPCDIVHTNSSKAGIIGRIAAAKAKVPVIVHTVFGWGYHDHMRPSARRLYIKLEQRAARVTDRIITVSHANKAKGLGDGIGSPDQYSVIYNAIEIAKYRDVTVDRKALRQALGIPPNAPVVGTVSRLAAQKAPTDFLRVAEMVHARCPEAHFLMVGGGPLHQQIEKKIRQHNLQGVVHLLGYRQDVPELLRVFDVFLLTSLWEGLPMVVPQAMCASLPSVATAVDGTPEVVSEGETGFLASAHDCAHMADRVIQLLGNPDLRRRFGKNALERVHPAFSDEVMVRKIEDVYLDCARAKNLLTDTPAVESGSFPVLRPATR